MIGAPYYCIFFKISYLPDQEPKIVGSQKYERNLKLPSIQSNHLIFNLISLQSVRTFSSHSDPTKQLGIGELLVIWWQCLSQQVLTKLWSSESRIWQKNCVILQLSSPNYLSWVAMAKTRLRSIISQCLDECWSLSMCLLFSQQKVYCCYSNDSHRMRLG